ncbi:hypothetical protein [Enemella evansiae]|uniref:hypothetical protein n=1 Tax=Enemella evansiae TaxID=2016499 RepID=UPI0011803493|nr:hypothetical protein [Enemella evansiae]
MERDVYPASQALNDITASRQAVADRLITPRWYHPVLALGIAGFILGVGLLPVPWSVLPSLLLAILCGWLIGAYSRLTGIWVRPTMGQWSGRLWIMHSVILVACVLPAILALSRLVQPPIWLLIAAAVVAAGATMIIGPRIDAAMRAELRAGVARSRR